MQERTLCHVFYVTEVRDMWCNVYPRSHSVEQLNSPRSVTSVSIHDCLDARYHTTVANTLRYAGHTTYSSGNEIRIVATVAILVESANRRNVQHASHRNWRPGLRILTVGVAGLTVGWNERRVRRITQWKKQMKLNRKTARARKTHSVVHLVQLRQKVHRPFFLPSSSTTCVLRWVKRTSSWWARRDLTSIGKTSCHFKHYLFNVRF